MSRISVDSGRKMGGEDCGGLRNWKEDIYWSHFQTVQFFQTLTGRYHQLLAIPQKFVNNLREKLAGDVALRGPSGVVWNVGVTAFANTLYFKNGWKEFVQDHNLEENDVLIFKYTGNSRFDVLMFDQKSLCEKEGSYFITRCDNEIENVEVDSNQEREEISPATVEVSHESLHEVHAPATSKRLKKDDMGTTSRSVGRPLGANANKRSKNRRGHKGSALRSSVSGQDCLSRRRPVTDEEKQNALNGAIVHAAELEASFVMIMRRSHVHTAFYVSVPAEWASEHLKCRSQYKNVILQVEEKTWEVRFHVREHGCGLAGGWRKFAAENYLEESDALVFNLVTKTTDTITLNVRIFRVVEDNIHQHMTPAPQVIVGGVGRGRQNRRRRTTN